MIMKLVEFWDGCITELKKAGECIPEKMEAEKMIDLDKLSREFDKELWGETEEKSFKERVETYSDDEAEDIQDTE